MPPDDRPHVPARAHPQVLQEAEARGKQVLLYQPAGVLGGTFTCARCGMNAVQPDLLLHVADCPYAAAGASITVW